MRFYALNPHADDLTNPPPPSAQRPTHATPAEAAAELLASGHPVAYVITERGRLTGIYSGLHTNPDQHPLPSRLQA